MRSRAREDEEREHGNRRSSSSREPSAAEPSPAITSDDVLRLQRSAGNHAVSNLLSGGLVPDAEPSEEEPEFIGGQTVARTFGEAVGDIARPVGVGLGNLVGGIAGAVTGVSISTTDNAGPTWNANGSFTWDVGITTTGTSGWIVQKVVNTFRGENAAGPLAGVPTPEYWEAWAVDGASLVTPSAGATNDMWRRPARGAGSKGHWSMRGTCYFTATDPATQGFAAGNVPDAGILLSSTAEPPGLGIGRLHRYAQGTWDSTAGVAHAGSAGP